MSKVYVIGSINQDIVVGAERHPQPGETIHGTTLNYFPGGKGANQAVAAARAGVETIMIGAVGSDDSGRQLCQFLAENAISTAAIKSVESAPTGTAHITVASGENTIVVVAGANAELEPGDIEALNFAEGDVAVAQFETSLKVTQCAFQKAKQAGAQTILNPAPAATVPAELLELTDYLIVNEHEFKIVFDQPLDLVPDFAGTIIVTLGARGALLLAKGTRHEQSGVLSEAVDSTGAGDCFVGYFAAALVQKQSPEQALAWANAAAALSVTRPGAANSMPRAEEVRVSH